MSESYDQIGEREYPAGGLDELVAALADKDPIARQKARHALVATGGAAVDPLAAALGDARPQVRWEAAKALVRVANVTAAPALVASLEDKDAGVRWLAAEALIAVGPEAVPSLLQALANRSGSLWLFEGAHHVLHAMETSSVGMVVRPVLTALEHAAREDTVPTAASEALRELKEGT